MTDEQRILLRAAHFGGGYCAYSDRRAAEHLEDRGLATLEPHAWDDGRTGRLNITDKGREAIA